MAGADTSILADSGHTDPARAPWPRKWPLRPALRHRPLWLLALLLSGCAGEGIVDPAGPGPSCTDVAPFRPELHCIQRLVFTPTCAVAGCHLSPNAQLGQDLSEGMALASIVGVRSAEMPALFRVEAGDPAHSYLILKLEGDPNVILGDRMPLGGPYLSQVEIDVIRQWILDGALDN